MTERVRVKAELQLFVDDAAALRKSAFERLRSAWTSDDDFPFESSDDVSLEQAIASALADALPIEFPGARRSALNVETESEGSDDSDDKDKESEDKDKNSDEDSDEDKDDETG